MKRILADIVMVSIVLALVAGCGGGASETPATEQPPASQPTQAPATAQSASQPTVNPTEPPASTPTPVPAAEEDATLVLDDRQTGLAQLSSYRAQWEGAWKSAEGDQTTDVMWEWYQEHTADPEATYLRLTSTDLASSGEPTAMEIWQIGETFYFVTAEGVEEPQCIAMSGDDQDPVGQGMFDLGVLGRVDGAKYLSTETVNGIRAKHYKYDEKAVTLAGAAKVSGDLWVAVDGGYVVKDTLTWEGGVGFFDPDSDSQAQGQGAWTWQLLEVNSRLSITPPAGCESATDGLPVLPDATEKSTFGDMLAYKTGASVADAARFYQEEMVKAGWTVEGEPMITADLGMLGFVKDGQTAQIMLSPDGDKTSILIMLQE